MREERIISYKNKVKEKWDILVILMAILNSILIPISMAFNPEQLRKTGVVVMDSFIDFFFIADIILMFFTSYQNKQG